MIRNRDDSASPRTTGASDDGDLTPADLCEVLGDALRRRVLRELDPESGPVRLQDLADQLADESAPDHVAVRLHHNHLPKLAEKGLVSYDAAENVVTPRPRPAWVESYLDV